MDKIKKYKFIIVVIAFAALAVAPLTGCKIIKLPYTIVKSVATDVGDAVGLVDKEELGKEKKSDTVNSSEVVSKEKEVNNSLGVFYLVWLMVLMVGGLVVFIKKNKDRTNGHLKPPTS